MTRRPTPRRPGVSPSTDPRFRRAEAPGERRRRGRGIWRLVRLVVPGLLLFGAVAAGGAALAGSDAFRVRDLAVSGNSRLTTAEIESLASGLRGENVLQVDLDHYARQIRDSAWVADVRLSRVLPATIAVDVREREPMAIARHNQRLYLVDDTGIIIGEYSAAHREFDLPVVDGLLLETGDGDLLADPERVGLARGLLEDLARQAGASGRLSQIDVSNARDARVLYGDDPAWLHLGQERFGDRLRTYLELRPALDDRYDAIDYVDLRFDERVYVKGTPDGGLRGR